MHKDVKYLKAQNLDYTGANMDIFHGFFTRVGGGSSGLYDALNCGIDVGDNEEIVAANRSIVARTAGVNPEDLLSLYQVHGTDVVSVVTPWIKDYHPSADACTADKPYIALSILTADCAPVLFIGHKSDHTPVIGAAHAGWRGALGGVMESTIKSMLDMGANINTIRAAIGPCISKESYEVKEDFSEPFLHENQQSEQFFYTGQKTGCINFDLLGYCVWRLKRFGVKNVSSLDIDTYTNEEMFYSYRRSVHREEKSCGRQISVIAITFIGGAESSGK